ncbi:hypothetical protein C1646_753747 [Rhizophagus diaphanus]|nr:hypothetical protein C1646_753747 [Rhizophagus diaphanus] [Rhizophagus sp. MUCL 43196]
MTSNSNNYTDSMGIYMVLEGLSLMSLWSFIWSWSIKSCQGRVLELYLILIRDVLRAINDNNNYIDNKKSDVCSVDGKCHLDDKPFESYDNIHDEVALTSLLLMLNGIVKLQF